MFGNRDIPVYLFTGFLESGKTTCIKEILQEGNFEDPFTLDGRRGNRVE